MGNLIPPAREIRVGQKRRVVKRGGGWASHVHLTMLLVMVQSWTVTNSPRTFQDMMHHLSHIRCAGGKEIRTLNSLLMLLVPLNMWVYLG
jgi:hypothetical protein